MNNDLFTALRALAQPGAALEIYDFPEFGLLLPLCHIIGAQWYDVPVDYADMLTLQSLGYIALSRTLRHWKRDYAITEAGRAALAAEEKPDYAQS